MDSRELRDWVQERTALLAPRSDWVPNVQWLGRSWKRACGRERKYIEDS